MTYQPRLLVFSGSLRKESWNHAVALIAGCAAESAGAQVTTLRLADYPLPLYDQDIETSQGLPETALALKQLFREHDGYIIGCPEYNSSITGALKNVIDWVSRPEEGHPSLDGFKGKVAGLVACSPGRLGGIRGLPAVHSILASIGVHVIPTPVAVPNVHEGFENGRLGNEAMQTAVENLGKNVAEHACRHCC